MVGAGLAGLALALLVLLQCLGPSQTAEALKLKPSTPRAATAAPPRGPRALLDRRRQGPGAGGGGGGEAIATSAFDEQVNKFDDFIAEMRTKTPVFEYADLSEIKSVSWESILFLLTNIPFALAAQMIRGTHPADLSLLSLASSLDISCVFSILYHSAQLYYGPDRKEVRRFLALDYISAFFTCTLVTLEIFPFFMQFYNAGLSVAAAPIFTGVVGLGCLWLCWYQEYGKSYLFWHGMWHVFSAYTAVLLAGPR